MIVRYAQDCSTGRVYGVMPAGDTLALVDMERLAAAPIVLIRLADLWQENRFREVASTRRAA